MYVCVCVRMLVCVCRSSLAMSIPSPQSPFKTPLPSTVRMLSFNALASGEYLLRLFNGDSANSVTIDLSMLFDPTMFVLATVQPAALSLLSRLGPAVPPAPVVIQALDIATYVLVFKA